MCVCVRFKGKVPVEIVFRVKSVHPEPGMLLKKNNIYTFVNDTVEVDQ